MRWDKTSVRDGMFVMGTQGERIGKVIRCDTDTFVVEKGLFFPKDYELRYDHITDISGGTVRYALTDFLRGRDLASPAAAPAATPREAAITAAALNGAPAATARAPARRAEQVADREENPHPAPARGDRNREGRARIRARSDPQDGPHRGEALLGAGDPRGNRHRARAYRT